MIKRIKPSLMLVLLSIFSTSWTYAAEEIAEYDMTSHIRIESAWIREAPPGITTLAAYLTFHNDSDHDLVMICANSPQFDRVEFHESRVEDGVASMRHLNEVFIPAGASFKFEPGGYHFMLIGNQAAIKAGDMIPISFIFKEHDTISVDAKVRRITSSQDHSHHGH